MSGSKAAPCVLAEALVVERGSLRLELGDWAVQPGEVVGVVGHNGAGKSTLLRTLVGLVRPTSGELTVLGRDPARDPVGVRSRVGFMAADVALWDLRVAELMHTLSGYWPTWDAALVADLLTRLHVPVDTRVSALSRGSATLVRVIAALAPRPALVLLDEPAAELDPDRRRLLMAELMAVVRDGDRAVVLASHVLEDVERIADRLLVLNRGRVVARGPTDEVVGDDRTLQELLLAAGS